MRAAPVLAPVLVLALALALALPSGPAGAGDTAEAEVLGFGDDGGLFAFAEYGTQDGSGFPYANIFVVDVGRDRWVEGTPIRVRLEQEGATVAEARAEAGARLRQAVGDVFRPAEAVTLAHSPLGEIEADPVRLAFAPIIPSDPLAEPDRRYEARLEIFQAEAQAENCVEFIGDRPMGFRLVVGREGGGEVVLHEDRTIPRSRGCPITYRLDRIVVPQYPPDRVAVLVGVFSPGFEGPQRRFIAVTGRLPK
jgi:predicted secreted protein